MAEDWVFQPSVSAEDAVRVAKRLGNAWELVNRNAPPGRNRDEALHAIERIVRALQTQQGRGICRRCNAAFCYDPNFFAERGMHVPMHCTHCRFMRREERRRAGVGSTVFPQEHP